jgi:chaperonin GroES
METLQMIGDRVLVKPDMIEEKTAGGIFIPDTAKERPSRGEVISVGPGVKDVEMVVNVGDKVLFTKYGNSEITLNGQKHLIMKQNDILAIVK